MAYVLRLNDHQYDVTDVAMTW